MDIAAEMILNTDEKSYTIAEKVGYLDANYFSYVFKKKFGVSPSKYRASVKQNSNAYEGNRKKSEKKKKRFGFKRKCCI